MSGANKSDDIIKANRPREMTAAIDQLLSYCRENERVCPIPDKWNQLYQMLPDTHRKGGGWEPSLPLILNAWWEASDDQKRQRFTEHVRWAVEHAALDEIGQFLRSLAESDWYHRGD
jgi:hypothetical protein